MFFNVYDDINEAIHTRAGEYSLIRTGWDDYGFQTEYELVYHNRMIQSKIGYVKIGYLGQPPYESDAALPKRFAQLPEGWFSLGQSESYYAQLKLLFVPDRREALLRNLRDVAFDLELLNRIRMTELTERAVLDASLLRSVTEFSVRHQFHRLAHGGVRLSQYSFTYAADCDPDHPELGRNILKFDVMPDTCPPSNVHVLIGRNGTGKTSMLKDMILSIRSGEKARGVFEYGTDEVNEETFANVICVAFSPFDDFAEIEGTGSIPYSYVGLNKTSGDLSKSIEEKFTETFSRCMISRQKRALWQEAIDILQMGDDAFQEANIQNLAGNSPLSVPRPEEICACFSPLSSGHKVVLLTVTSCVDRIEERSILFLDEPENHLHPPLLAALIRALSDLLIKRNGVAIISTHSPVVLQEVPDNCVWKLTRKNNHLVARRPAIQTFGETIGALTNEVFGLEIRRSGFYKLLADDVKQIGNYEAIYQRYDNGRFGTEAELLLRTLLAAHRRGEKIC